MTDRPVDDSDWIGAALERYEGDLTRYAQRLTGNFERAREVVQETFLRLCREDRLSIDGHICEWLFTVCRNQALDVRRKESRMATLAEEQVLGAPCRAPLPAVVAEQHDSTARILRLLNDLPENQQEVIRLKFHESLSYAEISRITGLTVSNVGFLIHRGLKAVRERMNVGNS